MDSDNPRASFDAFLSGLKQSATRPFDLPADQREVYYTLTRKSIFPIFSELAAEVTKKGMPAPIAAQTPTFYSHQTVDRGLSQAEWLSVKVHTPISPSPLRIGDKEVGNVTSTLYVSDNVNSVSFKTLDTGEVVFANENMDGTDRVLNTSSALFEPVPSHKLYPAGNPAAWVNKIVERKMLDKMQAELAAKPPR